MQVDIGEIQTWEEAISVGMVLIEEDSESRWQLGDLANHIAMIKKVDPLAKEKSFTIKCFAQSVGQTYSVVKEAARVAKNVPVNIRRQFEILGYGHFREIVRRGNRGGDIVSWAERAADGSMAIGQLRKALYDGNFDPLNDSIRRIRRVVDNANGTGKDNLLAVSVDDYEEILELQQSITALLLRVDDVMSTLAADKASGLE